MSGMLDFKAGRLRATKDGRVAFDTDTPAARLAPSEKLLLTGYSFEFPDIWKGIIHTTVYTTIKLGDVDVPQNSATTYIGLIGQEWGPEEPADYNLPDIVLGPAPPGANYLNTKVKLTRTVTPGKVAGDLTIPEAIPVNRWTRIEGASCPIESYGPLRRNIDILIVGGNIVLRRTQSIIDTQGTVQRTNTSPSSSPGAHVYYRPGLPGTNAGFKSGSWANVGQWLQNRGPSGSRSIDPGGSDAPTYDTSLVSYRSVWSGDLEITPGRVG